jgi:hypothetical protein
MQKCLRIALFAAGAMLNSIGVYAGPASVRHITVRTYNTFGIGTKDLAVAEQKAEQLLLDAGITTQWRDCTSFNARSLNRASICGTPLSITEFILRVSAVPARWEDPLSFGYSLVDALQHTGSLSTIFADRITASARRLHLDQRVFLARAIAHELGHLILGSGMHAPVGLMRAHWSDQLLQADRDEDWAFLPSDMNELTRSLDARNALAVMPAEKRVDLRTH